MNIKKTPFGITASGQEASLYAITADDGMSAVVSDFGAVLVSLHVPDGLGSTRDVVWGYDELSSYERPGFFGATVGRNANRIACASFSLDDIEYHLIKNEGENNLHSDFNLGFHKQMWEAEILSDGVVFSRLSPDGECGFPGNVHVRASYRLLPDHALEIHYEAVTDKKTILNMTNHSFFNLAGHDAGSVLDHHLWLDSSYFTELNENKVPTGRILPVDNTPMDFRNSKPVGKDINCDHDQLHISNGYDHNWILNTQIGHPRLIARVEHNSGLAMEVLTDLPGVQFYTANSNRPQIGKGGSIYDRRGALCLETQYSPDNIHHPHFGQSVFDPGETYQATTIYRFTTLQR